jgi:hypothetical protein
VSKENSKKLQKHKEKIERRLGGKGWKAKRKPMFSATNIHYEVSEKAGGIGVGGIGAFHVLATRIGLQKGLDEKLHLLKRHLPYHESDHVLNLAYNVLTSGKTLGDIHMLRNDNNYLNALHTERIPDATTEGDFLRRFGGENSLVQLMECINECRLKVWNRQKRRDRSYGVIDVDGTIAATTGECKQGMDMSYKGVWGYDPLVITLANTREPLYLVNRPGNAVSHKDAVRWMDKAARWVRKGYKRVCLRGDTDFALTAHFDRWTERGVDFVFGVDAMKNLVQIAELLDENRYLPLVRNRKYEVKTSPRRRPPNIKEAMVRERGYENIKLRAESVAEFSYRPGKCKRSYRMIVLRKNVSVEKGELVLFDDIRYFFYITSIPHLSPQEVVRFANQRCNQENTIEQLKNGVNALRLPSQEFYANWAYMVIAALAWNMKTWFGLLMEEGRRGQAVIGMEFRRFLNTFIKLPCQIIRGGRRITFRLLTYNPWLKAFLATFERIKALDFG